MLFSDAGRPGPSPPVLWTRGQGCGELAALLSEGDPVRVVGDLTETCLRHRAELLVSRRLSDVSLVSMAVPVDFDTGRFDTVVAAVAGGPHSPLAARVAGRIGARLGIGAQMVCAFRDDEGRANAVSLIERLHPQVPGIEYRLVEAEDASGLVSSLPETGLLVIGAPGGGWLQRTFFGQGARLRQRAPAGAVVVRSAPPRIFQLMVDPVFVGPLREAADILRIHRERVLAVVDRARLVGIVRRGVLEEAPARTLVAAVMEEPVSVPMDAPLDGALPLREVFGVDPIPVTDEDGRLVGGLLLPG